MSHELIIGTEADLLVTYGVFGFEPDDLECAGIPTFLINRYCDLTIPQTDKGICISYDR
ncbi:hypothetical protein [Gracilibacillus orientalis]|uniref:hypothetical protein n=1 Tax=Gracilibacillus orientalis TaxID=334253 RepID=UPI0015875A41|nr:hypothetical protein [Gracilibacillus orientalis]